MSTVAQLSLQGSVVIAGAALLRALFLTRLPKSTFTALWLVAAIRLVTPLSVPVPVAAPAAQTAAAVLTTVEQAIPRPASVFPWGTVLWLTGAALCAAALLGSHIRCMGRYREALPLADPAVDAVIRAFGLRRTVRVRVCQGLSTPLTYGVFRPVILLPRDMDRRDRRKLVCILTHELVHIQRLHIPFKYLLSLALCLHWFNPLVWCMYVLASRDIELACDEAVLRRLSGGRAEYAMTLIALEERRAIGPLLSGFGAKAVRERIAQVMRFHRKGAASLLAAAGLVLCSVTVFATAAEADTADLSPQPAVTQSPPFVSPTPTALPALTMAAPTPTASPVVTAAPTPWVEAVYQAPAVAAAPSPTPTSIPLPDRGTPPAGLPDRAVYPTPEGVGAPMPTPPETASPPIPVDGTPAPTPPDTAPSTPPPEATPSPIPMEMAPAPAPPGTAPSTPPPAATPAPIPWDDANALPTPPEVIDQISQP